MSGSCVRRAVSWLNRATTSRGVPAGASSAYQVPDSKPGTPVSAIVGSCGVAALRRALVTPSARRRPALTCGSTDSALANMKDTWPESRSVTASGVPLYGTCTTSMRVCIFSISAVRCGELPLPVEA